MPLPGGGGVIKNPPAADQHFEFLLAYTRPVDKQKTQKIAPPQAENF